MTTATTSRSPTLAEVITNAVEFFLEDVHVALPGKINNYDPGDQRAEIQPLIQRRIVAEDGEEILESLPAIPDVPVIFPRSGEFFLSFPLKKGDHVMLVFQERSLDNFLSAKKGQEVDPDEFRKHDLTDAVAYPGLYPFGEALNDADADKMMMGKDSDGAQIQIEEGGSVKIKMKGSGDISIIPSGAGKVHVGAETGTLATARVSDLTISGTTMAAWILAINTYLGVLTPLFNALSGTPVVSGGPGTVIPPISPTDFGIISTGATKSTAT